MRRSALLAWLYFCLMAILVAAGILLELSPYAGEAAPTLPEMLLPLVLLSFAFVGALIISRQPRNAIGLLMLLPSASLAVLLDAYLKPYINGALPVPTSPSPLFLLILWYSGWNWLLLVFPLLFIMVLFPTGRPFSRRWGWLIPFGIALAAVVFLAVTFGYAFVPVSGDVNWSVPNPIGLGFLTADWVDTYVLPIFFVALPVWVLLCAVSLFVRYRQARRIEREQIKWLFFAGVIFAASYIPTFLKESFSDSNSLWNIVWMMGMLTIPVAIAIAILRYRLYDINVIIRKTLVYAALSVLLALVYFGSVILLQTVFDSVTQEQSPLVIIFSTLLIAALFAPLRRRVQAFIDRRFYRQKYNAQQILDRFAQTARDEVSLETLSAELVQVVQETMEPESVSVWLKEKTM